ncbi:hypothetical protein Sjap_002889 [Stephania japonica]|uniref:Uncharacterized protein n=1 Tax=Stephania japonica TaxID=461633 RepID=A0AAP0PUY3_9MAGN
MTNLGGSNLGNQVQCALEQPLHKGMPRLEARNYISLYQEECKWSNILKKLALLDFNNLSTGKSSVIFQSGGRIWTLLQSCHLQETDWLSAIFG